MSKANRVIIVIGLFLMVLVVSNPSERSYLNEIGAEYGSVHHGMAFSPAQLLEIGRGERSNLILFSQYRYEFGNIAVDYLGFCGIIIKTGSESDLPIREDKSSDQIMA